ncbi:MAG: R3H domain-containing nucleic acid-binding protein, partial [Chloroflexota bacterium]
AHGNTLDNLMMNPTLADLIGGIQSVTLSDEEARRRGTQKSILERKAPPTFDVVIEIQDRDHLNVHHDVSLSVDMLLRGKQKPPELRYRDGAGQINVETAPPSPTPARARGERAERVETAHAGEVMEPRAVVAPSANEKATRTLRTYPYGVSQTRVQQVARSLQVPVAVVDDLDEADVVLTLKNYYRKRPQRIGEAERRGIPIYVLRSNSPLQIESCLADIFGIERRSAHDPFEEATAETRTAIEDIRTGRRSSVDLTPQNAFMRRKQHELAREANLLSRSHGKEPKRSVKIYQNNG